MQAGIWRLQLSAGTPPVGIHYEAIPTPPDPPYLIDIHCLLFYIPEITSVSAVDIPYFHVVQRPQHALVETPSPSIYREILNWHTDCNTSCQAGP